MNIRHRVGMLFAFSVLASICFCACASAQSTAAAKIGALQQEVAYAQAALNKAQTNLKAVTQSTKDLHARVEGQKARRQNALTQYNNEAAKLKKEQDNVQNYGRELVTAKGVTQAKKAKWDQCTATWKEYVRQNEAIYKQYDYYLRKGDTRKAAFWGEKVRDIVKERANASKDKVKAENEYHIAKKKEAGLTMQYNGAVKNVKDFTINCIKLQNSLRECTKSTQEDLNLLAKQNQQYKNASSELAESQRRLAAAKSKLNTALAAAKNTPR